MKKFIVAILAVLYLGTSTGATVHIHYCMGKLVDWGLWSKKGDNCDSCGMSKTEKQLAKDCCKDEQKQVKLDNDQKVSEATVYIAQLPVETVTPAFSNYSFEYVSSLTEELPVVNPPPRMGNVPLFFRNCVFRI